MAHIFSDTNTLKRRSTITRPVRLGILLWRTLLAAVAGAGVVVTYGFYEPVVPILYLHTVMAASLVALFADDVVRARTGRLPLGEPFGYAHWGIALLGVVGLVLVGIESWFAQQWGAWHIVEATAVLLLVHELWRVNVGLSRYIQQPGVLMPLSFVILIVVGTGLLKLPVAVPAGQTMGWLDAMFTATSASCVTGLIVRDTATQFTPFGQAIIGLLLQLGGLGIIIFGTMVALLLGSRLSLRQDVGLSQMLNDRPLDQVSVIVRFVVLTTLTIELTGALLLLPNWPADMSWGQRLGHSLFHAASAYCNAGFALYSDSLVSYRYSLAVHAVIGPLVILGGLGFPVLYNLHEVAWHRVRRWWVRRPDPPAQVRLVHQRLSLSTRVVLATTAVLYLFGFITILAAGLVPYLNQWLGGKAERLAPLTLTRLASLIADSSFMAITARTSGFNTVPMEELGSAAAFVLMTLMMIGGSPGGTAGGAKTTTAAVLVLSILATIRQRPETEAFQRRISDSLVRKAATVGAAYVALATASTLLLCYSEPHGFLPLAFEAVSASTTTGLSMGVTADLTPFGKCVIIMSMYLGRVGPLALISALLMSSGPKRPYAYAHEDVVLG